MDSTMRQIARAWGLDIQRGPNWLFVRVRDADDNVSEVPPLADQIRGLLEQHLSYRVVLELHEVERLDRGLIRQILLLDAWVREHGGLLRLCGLSPRNVKALRRTGLGDRFPAYQDRQEAVWGLRQPCQPR
jgi:anti-anti-sigma regulatory factor